MKRTFLCMTVLFYLSSCQFINNDKLDDNNFQFLESLDLLKKNEEIVWFDSQLTIKTSGNFLSNKRIAGYCFDKYHPESSFKEFAYLNEIENIKLINNSKSISYSSYIEVIKKNGQAFKVYIDKDSTTVESYYNQTLKILK